MRQQPAADTMTRFLIQKALPYAELEENSRIALSVLHDDGWSMDRIEMDLQVRVAATATIEQIDANAALTAQLQVAELRMAALRGQFRLEGVDEWLAIALGFILCAVLDWLGLAHWDLVGAAACVFIWSLVKRHVRKASK